MSAETCGCCGWPTPKGTCGRCHNGDCGALGCLHLALETCRASLREERETSEHYRQLALERYNAYTHALWAARMWRLLRPEGENAQGANDGERILLQALDDVQDVPDAGLPESLGGAA